MSAIKDYLSNKKNITYHYNDIVFRDPIVCKDGFSMSVQASKFHMCVPKQKLYNGEYKFVEVGYPNSNELLLKEHQVDKDIYFVPIEIIDKIIEKHNGLI